MRSVWKLALNDLRLTVRDRSSFVWMLAMPIAMMWLFSGIGGGGSGAAPQISLTVVNHDDGWLSTALIDELDTEGVSLARLTPDTAEGVEEKVRSLIIPEGFTSGVLAGVQQTVRLEREPGSSASFGMAADVHVTRAIVRLLGRVIELDQSDANLPGEGEPEVPESFHKLGERPRLVDLAVSTAGRGRPVPRGAAQSVPGNLTFVVMMMTLIYGAVFLTVEKSEGMLRRQMMLPISRTTIFLGKLFGRLLMAAIQIVLLVLAGRFLFDISWGNTLPGLIMVLASYSLAVAGLSTLLGAVLSTPAQASSVGWIGSMILAALGGCWWPAEVMPDWMRTVSYALPTGWAMDAFHSLITFGHGFSELLLPSAVLTGFGIVFSALGARFLRTS